MIFYWLGATMTFGLLLDAFHRDTETPKTDAASWIVLVVATLIWFIVLPRILHKKAQAAKAVSAAAETRSQSWIG